MNLRSPMSAALGKGAARGAMHHWWLQRVTAVALVPLTVWFVLALLGRPSLDYDSLHAWAGSGWTPVWLVLLIVSAAWHSALGMQVIIEDYVSGHFAKTAALIASTFAHGIAGAAALFAVLKIALQ